MKHVARRFTRSIAVGIGAVLTLTTLLATPAWAHVTLHPMTIPAGTGDVELTFRVPNERDNANTVGLQVFFPANLPLLTVNVLPVPGWTAKVDTLTLAKPIQSGDGPVSQIVTDIVWTASAGGIAPGQYQDFAISASQVPAQTGDVIFKSLQTYSSGEVVRWIQVASSQNPNPDKPAPVLTLTNPTSSAPAVTTSGSSNSSAGIAISSLVIAVIALLGVVALFIRSRRHHVPAGPNHPDSGGSTSSPSVP